MGTRPTQIQAGKGAAIARLADHRPRREQLVGAQCAVEDVAADQAEGAFQIERGQHLTTEHAVSEAGRIAFNGSDHQVGYRLAVVIPVTPIRKYRRHVLAEQAGHMLPGRCQ